MGERGGGGYLLACISACLTDVLFLVPILLFSVEVTLSNSGLNDDRFSKLISLASTENIHN